MKKLFLAAVAISALSIGATAAIADDHHGGHGHKGKMMERVDTNGDGQISKAEFMAKHEGKFVKMDANSDGFISKEEMKDAKGKMKNKMKERMENRKNMKDAE